MPALQLTTTPQPTYIRPYIHPQQPLMSLHLPLAMLV